MASIKHLNSSQMMWLWLNITITEGLLPKSEDQPINHLHPRVTMVCISLSFILFRYRIKAQINAYTSSLRDRATKTISWCKWAESCSCKSLTTYSLFGLKFTNEQCIGISWKKIRLFVRNFNSYYLVLSQDLAEMQDSLDLNLNIAEERKL
jgi:hypothetical protein